MEKVLIVIKEFDGRQVGDIDRREEASSIDKLSGNFYENYLKMEVPSVLDKLPIKSLMAGSGIEEEFWFKDGVIVDVDPEDDTWSHMERVDASEDIKITLDRVKYKEDVLEAMYEALQAEVYAEMKSVFGTAKSDSASADEATYKLWLEDPAFYAGNSLLAKANTTSFSKGDELDLEADISTYATEMLAKIKAYALWRKIKERDFSVKKASIEQS